jgi:hypothetical protein
MYVCEYRRIAGDRRIGGPHPIRYAYWASRTISVKATDLANSDLNDDLTLNLLFTLLR